MHGAAHLAGMGALRSGAGLVTVGVPESIYAVTARREAEVMVKPFICGAQGVFSLKSLAPIRKALAGQDVLAAGPGLSRRPETVLFLRRLLPEFAGPVVLDADGLNAFENHPDRLGTLRGRLIVTPHAGEFNRLFQKAGFRGDVASERERARQAAGAARKFGFWIILKGHKTVVAAPDGKVYLNATGNPGMATAGSGDVLTGVIAALLGQKFSFWDAARFGVYLHGLAGDLAAREKGEVSLVAGDLLEFLPAAFQKTLLRKRK